MKWPSDDALVGPARKTVEDPSSEADAIDALTAAARPYSRNSHNAAIFAEHNINKRCASIPDDHQQPFEPARSVRRRLDSMTSHNESQAGRLTPPTLQRPRSTGPRDDSSDTCAAEGRRLHIARLPTGTTEDDLRAFFYDYEVYVALSCCTATS